MRILKQWIYISLLFVVTMTMGWACQRSSDTSPEAPPPVTGTNYPEDTAEEKACYSAGWTRTNFMINSIPRKVLWKGPVGAWTQGTILVLHGGGGKASDFCSGGPATVPQIEFTNLAVQEGFGVVVLDSTDNIVTDAQGRPCGKRFDFSILNRPNIDLPYIEFILNNFVGMIRPAGSNSSLFMTGLSTGGYMTIRASTRFDNMIKAFAPVSAGDPYGTDPICDPSLSARESAIGILADRETGLEIVNDNACYSATGYPNENTWETTNPAQKPKFKLFIHPYDGIVDLTCMQKAKQLLIQKNYVAVDGGHYAVPGALPPKNVAYHLWLSIYNTHIINFFKSAN